MQLKKLSLCKTCYSTDFHYVRHDSSNLSFRGFTELVISISVVLICQSRKFSVTATKSAVTNRRQAETYNNYINKMVYRT
jgi:hypothetical protein